MKETGIIKGVDSIGSAFKGFAPMRVEVSELNRDLIEEAKTTMNLLGMALIPYCGECKEPLDLDRDNHKMVCPKCGREWVRV